MNRWVRVIGTGLAASAPATMVKIKTEGVLQPLGEKIFPPNRADKLELGADPAGHPENMPPSEVADRFQHAVTGDELSDEQRQKVSAPLHWGIDHCDASQNRTSAGGWSKIGAAHRRPAASRIFCC